MPRQGFGKPTRTTAPRYPIADWVSAARELYNEWKRKKKGRGWPYIELRQGRDFDIQPESLRRYLYRHLPQVPLSVSVDEMVVRIYWYGNQREQFYGQE